MTIVVLPKTLAYHLSPQICDVHRQVFKFFFLFNLFQRNVGYKTILYCNPARSVTHCSFACFCQSRMLFLHDKCEHYIYSRLILKSENMLNKIFVIFFLFFFLLFPFFIYGTLNVKFKILSTVARIDVTAKFNNDKRAILKFILYMTFTSVGYFILGQCMVLTNMFGHFQIIYMS